MPPFVPYPKMVDRIAAWNADEAERRALDNVVNGERDFTAGSVSGGVFVRPAENWFLGATLARTERAPTAVELFADGAHIATLLCALFLRHFRPLVAAGHVYVAMPPLYRIDLGKDIYYALDEAERDGILERLAAEKKRGKPQVTRFKGLGEMNPLQLRETTMDPNTRRLVQLTLEDATGTLEIMDMLLAKKRAGDRKSWLESKGNLAEVLV